MTGIKPEDIYETETQKAKESMLNTFLEFFNQYGLEVVGEGHLTLNFENFDLEVEFENGVTLDMHSDHFMVHRDDMVSFDSHGELINNFDMNFICKVVKKYVDSTSKIVKWDE